VDHGQLRRTRPGALWVLDEDRRSGLIRPMSARRFPPGPPCTSRVVPFLPRLRQVGGHRSGMVEVAEGELAQPVGCRRRPSDRAADCGGTPRIQVIGRTSGLARHPDDIRPMTPTATLNRFTSPHRVVDPVGGWPGGPSGRAHPPWTLAGGKSAGRLPIERPGGPFPGRTLGRNPGGEPWDATPFP